jgi:hypothetical protein
MGFSAGAWTASVAGAAPPQADKMSPASTSIVNSVNTFFFILHFSLDIR